MLKLLIALIIVLASIARLGAQAPWIGKSKKAIRGVTPGAGMDEIRVGRFLVGPPTLQNVGFRRYVEGDSNRNARVDVAYRKAGEVRWIDALPMLRIHHEIVNWCSRI